MYYLFLYFILSFQQKCQTFLHNILNMKNIRTENEKSRWGGE